jgi:dTDP-4-amino-4,6-dideoxygalactose transaminase
VFDHEDLEAVKRVLDSGNLCAINGQVGREFEEAFAREMGVRRAYGVNSGMSALHACVFAAGAGAGDEVICDSMVQFGSAAVMYNNAVPVFADVRRDTHCIDPESVRERITERTKAIICTHLWGLPCDMDPIVEIAAEHGLTVIEDNAHGLYGEYKGRLTGTLGHMAEFSFQMSKQLALGDAGMATTMDEHFEDALWDAAGHRQLATFPRLVWNYRLNELVSAVGLVQLKRARDYVESGIANAGIYNDLVQDVEWIAQQHVPGNRKHAYHIWAGTFEGDRYGISRERFRAAMEASGVPMSMGYIQKAPYLYEMYTEPLTYGRGCPISCPFQLRHVEYRRGLCPVAEDLMPRVLLIGTVGSREMHRENAEKLHGVIQQFS